VSQVSVGNIEYSEDVIKQIVSKQFKDSEHVTNLTVSLNDKAGQIQLDVYFTFKYTHPINIVDVSKELQQQSIEVIRQMLNIESVLLNLHIKSIQIQK
jgi:uncharacterized alkaline shock family protein YloU